MSASKSQRSLVLALSVFVSGFLVLQLLLALAVLRTTASPEIFLTRSALALLGFFFPIMGCWFSLRFAGAAVCAFLGAALVLFVGAVSDSPVFIWFIVEYGLLVCLLYRLDQDYANRIAVARVDVEKFQNEKNDLEASYQTKGKGISMLFEKYSTYYNLRKIAEDLATSLSLETLSEMVVRRASEFIPKGHETLLCFSPAGDRQMPVVASHLRPTAGIPPDLPGKASPGGSDLFTTWVVKNRRRLIVGDTLQDFRFDVKEAARQASLRSTIAAPLLYEDGVVGILRMNAQIPHAYTNDDLRLLDTIAVLASSALSNARLFGETENLAIRDSLTGLYSRRYFFDRLKEEHARALTTRRPLSLLMCDVDRFKDCNDRYGHAAGDLLLAHFAGILESNAPQAVVARYGGEEFALLLPEVSKEEARRIGERVRQNAEASPFTLRRETIQVTASVGVANFPDDTLDQDELLQKADQALYQAKHRGRNQVCCAGD